MQQYVRILPGGENARMNADNWKLYTELVSADAPPGEGWYPVVKGEKPEWSPGQVLWWIYAVEGGVARKVYSVDAPSRTFRKSWLAQWLYFHRKWDAFKALLSQSPDLEFFWETSTEFDEDHPMWAGAMASMKTALGLTDLEVQEFLGYGATGREPGAA